MWHVYIMQGHLAQELHMISLGFMTCAEPHGIMSALFTLHTIELGCMTHTQDLKLWCTAN